MCAATARLASSPMALANTRSTASSFPSNAKLTVSTTPMFLISTLSCVSKRSSPNADSKSSPRSERIFENEDTGMCTPPCGHVCSMRAAKLGVSPKMSYCMHVRPTTPLNTGPCAKPTRTTKGWPSGRRNPVSRISWITPRPNVIARRTCLCASCATPMSAMSPATARYPSPTVRTFVTPCSSATLSTVSK